MGAENSMKKEYPKLIKYFEKRIQETERWISRTSGRDQIEFKAQLEELKTSLKYVRGGRWLK